MISNIVPWPGMDISDVWKVYAKPLRAAMQALTVRAVNLHVRPSFEDQYHHACWAVACRESGLRKHDDTRPEIWMQVLQHAADHAYTYCALRQPVSIREMENWRADLIQFPERGIKIPQLPLNATDEQVEIYNWPSPGLWIFEP